jgi:hypothetical protein
MYLRLASGANLHKADRSLAYSVRWQNAAYLSVRCQEGSSARTASAYRHTLDTNCRYLTSLIRAGP